MENRGRQASSQQQDLQPGALHRERSLRHFGARLTLLRQRRGWTQRELARRLGIPSSTVCRYESGTSTPPLRLAARIALTLEVSLDYLAFGPALASAAPAGSAETRTRRPGEDPT